MSTASRIPLGPSLRLESRISRTSAPPSPAVAPGRCASATSRRRAGRDRTAAPRSRSRRRHQVVHRAGGRGRDHRQAGGHRLVHDQPPRIGDRGEHEHIRVGVGRARAGRDRGDRADRTGGMAAAETLARAASSSDPRPAMAAPHRRGRAAMRRAERRGPCDDSSRPTKRKRTGPVRPRRSVAGLDRSRCRPRSVRPRRGRVGHRAPARKSQMLGRARPPRQRCRYSERLSRRSEGRSGGGRADCSRPTTGTGCRGTPERVRLVIRELIPATSDQHLRPGTAERASRPESRARRTLRGGTVRAHARTRCRNRISPSWSAHRRLGSERAR